MKFVLSQLRSYAAARRKAIVALLVPALTYIVSAAGLHLSADQIAALVMLLTPLAVHSVPNSPQ